MKPITKVFIVGGTHGNEWTGVQIVKHYQNFLKNKFPKLELEFILANPEAHQMNCRFKDEDLNRAFQFLPEIRPTYENKRAREIKELIQKGPCVVIDLHTTTSNMGKTVILSHYNSFNFSLCAKLSREFSDCKIIGAPDPKRKYLTSQSDFGLMIEVGPVANGVVGARALESSLDLLVCILEEIEAPKTSEKASFDLYEEVKDISYPVNENGQLNGYIHADFQGQDFQVLKGKYKPFKTFAGEEIEMKTEEEYYPIFINEAAYYLQQLAFTLCKKKTMTF